MSKFYSKKGYGDVFNLSSKGDFLPKDEDLETCICGAPVLSPLIQADPTVRVCN